MHKQIKRRVRKDTEFAESSIFDYLFAFREATTFVPSAPLRPLR